MIIDKYAGSAVYFFSDGSFYHPNRGAWGVVSVVLCGSEMRVDRYSGAITCTNSLIPEVVAAHQALLLASRFAAATLVVDNSNVFSHLKHTADKRSACKPGREVCAFWLKKLDDTLRAVEVSGCKISTEWVKAHKPLSALPPSPRRQEFLSWGNAQADRLAQKTAKEAPMAPLCSETWGEIA